jgi:hypothetical protein
MLGAGESGVVPIGKGILAEELALGKLPAMYPRWPRGRPRREEVEQHPEGCGRPSGDDGR